MDLPYDSFVHVFHEATARAAGVGIPVEFEPNHFVKMLLPGSDSELAAYERFGLTTLFLAGSMVVDGTAQLLHLERPTLRRHPGAPLPEMGDEVLR